MPRGGFGRGFGGGFGRGFGMRRMGAPIIAPVGGMGHGGMGSPLINTLMAGGLGYMLGSNSAQQQVQQPMVAAVPTEHPCKEQAVHS